MSKIKVVEIVEADGQRFGQISSPSDLVKAQQFAHAHVEKVTDNFLTNADEAEVAGCLLSLSVGLTVQIAAGLIYRSGLQYESGNQSINLDPANSINPRVDLIVAVLAANAPANTEFLAFQRLRTEQELDDDAPPYPPTQFQRATELHNIATIARKRGTASASPAPPALAANEVALYAITIPANAVALQMQDIADARKIVSNLRTINSQVASHQSALTEQQIQIADALAYEQRVRNFSSSFGRSDNLINILNEIAEKLTVLKYRYPTIVSGDGRCPADVRSENGTQVIDIPVGTLIQFGDKFVAVEPDKFADASVNARYANASNTSAPTYQPLIENESIPAAQNNPTGNVVRFDAPNATKALFLNYDGTLVFRDTAEASHGSQCLLLKIIRPNAGAPPVLKRYRNLRNSQTDYSSVAAANDAASKQFDLDLAAPVGTLYTDCYAIRAADNVRYQIPLPNIVFDAVIDVLGVADGDRWVVRLMCLSAL